MAETFGLDSRFSREHGIRQVSLRSLQAAVEPLVEDVARRAGDAIGAVRGATTIDAIVVASAATRGDVVLTSDAGDLRPLAEHLGGVAVVAI